MFLSSGWWSLWMQVVVVDVAILMTVFAFIALINMNRKRN